MARIPLSTTTSKRILLALIAACMTISAGADQILLDNGTTQLNVGTTANDGTGDSMRAGALKMKQWAADVNSMTTELYAFPDRYGMRNVAAYGAVCGTTSDDSAAFQSALTAAGSAGGGTVYAPACSGTDYYYFTAQIYVPSNVTLACQKGAVLKQITSTTPTHTLTASTGLVGFYGVSNAGIVGCKIDTTGVSNPANQANPIEVGSATPASGSAWTGTRSDGITISNVEISTNTNTNSPYSIWLHRADNVKVLDSRINGGTATYTATSDQVGVNIVGSRHVEVAGTKFLNLGRAGVIVSAYNTAAYAGYENVDINIHDNDIEGGKYGVAFFVAKDTAGNLNYIKGLTVSHNHINDPWLYGIWSGVSASPGATTTMFYNVLIDGNIVTMGELSQNPYGLLLGWSDQYTQARGFVVSNNQFYGGKGADWNAQTGLRISFANNITLSGNSWVGGDTTMADPATISQSVPVVRITPEASGNINFIANYFGQSSGPAILADGGDDYVWTGNTFNGFNATSTAAYAAIHVLSTTNRWQVFGNKFIKGAGTEGYLMQGTIANSQQWIWANNSYGYATTKIYQAVGLFAGAVGVPTGASGASAGTVAEVNKNLFGAFRLTGTGAYTEVTVTNASCKYCRINVTQIAGTDILPFLITTANGSFKLTVPSDPAADMDFRYEILN